MSANRVEVAEEHCKAAERSLKTSFTRWRPDFDTAASYYSQAAHCYKLSREPLKSMECGVKASENYLRARAVFHAAKSLEVAIMAGKDVAPPEELFNMALDSSRYYQQHGSGDAGAHVLDRTAKILEERAPGLAYKLFQRAADVSQTESSQHQGAEFMGKASRILVKMEKYDDAVECIRREISFHLEHRNIGAVGRLTCALVLVQLARGDFVAAEKDYKEWGNCCEQQEMETLEQLIAAYDEEDRDSARRALASPFIRNMDVEYSRLSTMIRLPSAMEPGAKPIKVEEATTAFNEASGTSSFQGHSSKQEASAVVEYTRPSPDEDEDLC